MSRPGSWIACSRGRHRHRVRATTNSHSSSRPKLRSNSMQIERGGSIENANSYLRIEHYRTGVDDTPTSHRLPGGTLEKRFRSQLVAAESLKSQVLLDPGTTSSNLHLMDPPRRRALGKIRSSTYSQIIAHHFLVFLRSPILSRSNGEVLPLIFETIPILIYSTPMRSCLPLIFVSIALPISHRSGESSSRELMR